MWIALGVCVGIVFGIVAALVWAAHNFGWRG